jgi:ABC-type uncharacterized transport system fused permease/ATPase subunit
MTNFFINIIQPIIQLIIFGGILYILIRFLINIEYIVKYLKKKDKE